MAMVSRLAELSEAGQLRLADGTRLHPALLLEFEAALDQGRFEERAANAERAEQEWRAEVAEGPAPR